MTPERFERESRYQAMLAISRSMMRDGLLSEDDFLMVETYLIDKYRPFFRAA